MQIIESTNNPAVKYVRRLQTDRRFRHRERVFIAEGTRWLDDLLQIGGDIQDLFFTEAWRARPEHAALLQQLPIIPRPVSEAVMTSISDMVTPAGVLVVLPQVMRPLPPNPSFLLILDRIRNPGNLGTICRTAAAAGVEGVLLTPGTVDYYNPKVVRGGMGAHLRVPVKAAKWGEIAQLTSGLQVWLADAGGETIYTHVNWRQPSALIIGSEAFGAGNMADELATGRVSIPIHSATESLNAAIAAGILLFEVVAQRWDGPRQLDSS